MAGRVAVVGCGQWGRNLARTFASLQALSIICDTNEDHLAAQAALHPGARLTRHFEDVLADEKIDAVALATPPALHYAQTRQALGAGKDVFVEKPLALRYDDGAELVKLAAALRRVLMVGHILQYHPAIVLLKDLVRGGELGRVRYIYSNRLNLGRVRTEENILWSFAPHDISVILDLAAAEPILVSASGGSYLQPGIFDVTVTNLLFANDVRAHIFVSWLHPYKEQRLVVVGDKKMAAFDDVAERGKLKVFDKGIDWRGGAPVARQTAETTLYFDEREPLRLECEHFLASIRDRTPPLTDGASALKVLRVLEAGQLSLHRDGAPVSFQEAAT